MMVKSLRLGCLATLLAFAGLGAFTSAPQAATLDLNGNGSTGTITYAGNGTGVTISSDPLAGTAFFGVLGNWSLSPLGAMTTGPENAQGQFAFISGILTDTLTINMGALGSLTATVTWATITDGSLTPKFNGSFVITSITPGSALLANFGGIGSSGGIDFTTNVAMCLGICTGVDAGKPGNLVGMSRTETSGGISGGELVPSPVPLPTAFPLFVGGLAGLWALGRTRRKQKAQSAIA